MNFNNSSISNVTLEEVKPQMPTVDLESPTSEHEDADICSIFQRAGGFYVQATEDNASLEDEAESPEQQDLDNYLQNLREDANNGKDRSHLEIMERLVAFSKSQLSKSGISSNFSSESKSTAKHTSHQQVSSCKKPSVDVHNGTTIDGSNVTDKRMLPPKARGLTRNGNKFLSTNPLGPGHESEPFKEKTSRSVSTCFRKSQHQGEGKQSSAVQPEIKTIPQNPCKEPKHLNRNDASVRGQHKPLTQTLQHKENVQILQLLEKHRPASSVDQKQPAAERTDVLYDIESSHLQSFNMLPEDIQSKDCILLMVHLSSPGMIRDRAHEKRKHRYPAEIKPHIYNTLVTWFLSLIGPDPHHDEHKGAKAPFWVAGLQQVWTEEGLALLALAVPHHSYSLRKRDFNSYLSNFLSETSLSQIAPWLPKLKVLLAQQAFASPPDLPSSSLSSFISATADKKSVDKTFGVSPGFYWQAVETQECVCRRRETTQELHTEVSFALGGSYFFLDPLVTHYCLQLVLNSGLDVCGLRLLYPPQRFLGNSAGVDQSPDDTCQPVLALAVRGPHAFSVLKDLTESLCPLMSKKTHPSSASQETCLFYSGPGLVSRVHKDLCLWFGGRLHRGTAQNHSQLLNRIVPSGDSVGGNLFNLSTSPAFLCATTKADVLLVVSPAVPPCCYGQVLAVCECRGFSLEGLQRLRLQRKSAALLRLTREQARVFCSFPTESLDQRELNPSSQCLVLLLKKENATHHSVRLPAALIKEFKAQKLLSCIHLRNDGVQAVEPSLCFHTVPYSSDLFHTFVKSMWTVPDPTRVILSHQRCQTTCDMEQVVILTLRGKDLGHGLGLLHRILTERPERFRLLGLKWLPGLSQLQAQELSPYELGETLFLSSVATLISSPVLLFALKRRDAFASLKRFLPRDYPGNLTVLMSSTPEVAFRQASLFFEHWMIKFFCA